MSGDATSAPLDGPAREATEERAPALEVIDVLGLCGLARRSATLDGSVPLRAAQACLPLLAGNAFGLQIVLRRRIELRRRLGGLAVAAIDGREEVERLHRGALPMLLAGGVLPRASAWAEALAAGVVATRPRLARPDEAPLRLFTGLLVRPRPGVRLRVASSKNRRSLACDVREVVIEDDAGFTPLVLPIDVRAGGDDPLVLAGEVATLAALPRAVELRALSLEEAPEVAAAHLAFYDRTYFETKRRGEVSRKYRRQVAAGGPDRGEAPAAEEGAAPVRLDRIEAGPLTVRASCPSLCHGPGGWGRLAAPGATPDRLVVENAVPLEVAFDGLHVTVTPEAAALERYASAVRDRWQPTLAAARPPAHQGALLYLTKYLTPHPPGEPHFFVKPAALFRTAPGVSLLVEGGSGDGFEVLRGVVESDTFHAAPAVFQLTRPGSRFRVEAGAPLAELMPVPRALCDPGFSLRPFGPLAGLPVAELGDA